MNKKGSVIIYGLMVALVLIVLALALAPSVSEQISTARNSSSGDIIGLDCGNDSISTFDKATCLTTDISLPYFIGGLIFIAGGFLTARMVF